MDLERTAKNLDTSKLRPRALGKNSGAVAFKRVERAAATAECNTSVITEAGAERYKAKARVMIVSAV